MRSKISVFAILLTVAFSLVPLRALADQEIIKFGESDTLELVGFTENDASGNSYLLEEHTPANVEARVKDIQTGQIFVIPFPENTTREMVATYLKNKKTYGRDEEKASRKP